MIRITTALLLGIICSSAHAQDHISYAVADTNGNRAHAGINQFVHQVHDALVTRYPARVKNISMFFTKANNLFSFRWECDIVSCDTADADYHFDQRGTLLSGNTPQSAFDAVQRNLDGTKKVQKMIDGFDLVYGRHFMPVKWDLTTYATDAGNAHVWCIREFFCSGPKTSSD